jgi:hypothetical protein
MSSNAVGRVLEADKIDEEIRGFFIKFFTRAFEWGEANHGLKYEKMDADISWAAFAIKANEEIDNEAAIRLASTCRPDSL